MRERRRWAPWTVIAGGCFVAAGCSAKASAPPGGVMVAITSDLSIPMDIGTIDIFVTENGTPLLRQIFLIGPAPAQTLPFTLPVTLRANDPGARLQIRVVGSNGDKPRILRDATVVVPATGVGELRMPLDWLCDGSALSGPADSSNNPTYVSSCPAGQTCVAGSCANANASLPVYDPADVYGGSSSASGGACFDTLQCFGSVAPASLDMATCTVPAPAGGAGTNVAIVLTQGSGDGICGPAGCLVPLDGNSAEGWQESAGTLRLPGAVCAKIASGKASGVVTSSACATKSAAIPTCGPWSSVGG